MRSNSLRHRAPLLWLLMPWGLGLVSGRMGMHGAVWMVLGGALVASLVSLRCRTSWGWAWSLGLGMVLAGNACYQIHRCRLLAREGLPVREAMLELSCESAAEVGKAGRRALYGRVESADHHLAELQGQRVQCVLERGDRVGEVVRGARVRVKGVLAPVPFEGTADGKGFENYLADAGVGFVLKRAELVELVRRPGPYDRLCIWLLAQWRENLGEGVRGKRPELVRIYEAMLLGLQSRLTKEQVERYRLSGTMHLFSISGLHIAVIALALDALLGLCRLGGWRGFAVGACLLWLYVDVTGASPSAIRSFGMVILFQLAYLVRRQVNPVATLVAAAFGVFVLSPMDFFSAGFQMSYGIVAGLLLLGLPMAEAGLEAWDPLKPVPEIIRTPWAKAFEWVRVWFVNSMALGLSSSCTGLVAGILFFGMSSHGGLLANLLMIPVSSLVVLAGFMAIVAGSLGCGPLTLVFNHAGLLVLWGMEWFLVKFLGIKGLYGEAAFAAPWVGRVCMVLLFAGCVLGYHWRWGRRRWLTLFPVVATAGLVWLCLA